jgi:hypothetical protein
MPSALLEYQRSSEGRPGDRAYCGCNEPAADEKGECRTSIGKNLAFLRATT